MSNHAVAGRAPARSARVLMLAALFPLRAALLPGGIAPASAAPDPYERAGQVEDTPAAQAAKCELLAEMNRARRTAGAPPMEMDPLATQVANAHAREMLAYGYLSHWDLQGFSPHVRYSLAGGSHSLAENVGAVYTCILPSQMNADTLRRFLFRTFWRMMSETGAPMHRQTILDPANTHVGIGHAMGRSGFRVAYEFIRRCPGVPPSVPSAVLPVALGEYVLRGRVGAEDRLASVSVSWEPLRTRRMAVANLNRTGVCSLPKARWVLSPRLPAALQYADGSRGEVSLDEEGGYSVPIRFRKGRGIYTAVVWVRRGVRMVAAAVVSIPVRDSRPVASLPPTGR